MRQTVNIYHIYYKCFFFSDMCCCWEQEVGYMVRGDCKASSKTKLLFCTYGVLLRRLQQDTDLAAIDYVIFDEVTKNATTSIYCTIILELT